MLLSLAPVQVPLAHAWNPSRALGTGSGRKQAHHTESFPVPGRDPEHQTHSHSHSPDLELIQMFWRQLAQGERSNKQRQHTLTCLEVIQHAGFFLTCRAEEQSKTKQPNS